MVSRADFERICIQWRGVTIVEQWDSCVAKVGGKVFGLKSDGGNGAICLKVRETSFEILTAMPDIGQAPYFAKRQWVSIAADALSVADIEAYLKASYDLVAAGLTKKLQREPGLVGLNNSSTRLHGLFVETQHYLSSVLRMAYTAICCSGTHTPTDQGILLFLRRHRAMLIVPDLQPPRCGAVSSRWFWRHE
ncbi:MmcQ/YjbR family DNA-binding protein [Devosia algicola]|uniref:MmcQ/YjbR family DNA-binding protein n=1 Tax=Devosia algicola TaxID=3026418 RepID=UPI002E23538C